jgi:hypothetical protein
VCVDGRTVFDLPLRQRNIEALGLPFRLTQCEGRDQHKPPVQPVPGINHQVANGPAFIVEIEVSQNSNLTIPGSNRKTRYLGNIS